MPAGDLITDLWQIQWRGLLLGWPATSLGITNLTGWLDMPASRATLTPRPGRHGAVPSQRRVGGRTVEAELTAIVDDPSALPALINATAPGEDDDEEPLVIWSGTAAPQLIYARCERRAIPTDQDWSVGYQRATLQWVASDPRMYDLTESTQSIGLPNLTGAGLTWPLAWPLDWGSAQSGGRMSLTNGGNVPTWPTWTITGPVTGPIITNPDSGDRLIFDPTYTVPAATSLVIDTDQCTVTLLGVSQRARLIAADWFALAADAATGIQFTSVGGYDPAASLTATWRPASM